MLTKVRIAPVEQWCELPKLEPSYYATVGMTVEIYTEGMQVREGEKSPYREWPMSEKSSKKISEITGVHYSRWERIFVCEHMLQMD